MDEDDLIEFLREGPKVGEKSFRDRFGYCPRGLLRVLTGTIVYKYKERGLVTYRLMEDVFINDEEIDDLILDNEVNLSDSIYLGDNSFLERVLPQEEIDKEPIPTNDFSQDFHLNPKLFTINFNLRVQIENSSMSNEEINKLLAKSEEEIFQILNPPKKRKSFLGRIFK